MTFYLLAAVGAILIIPAIAQENWIFGGVMLAVVIVCGLVGRLIKADGKWKDL